MTIKNKMGVTLTILVITIVVMMILFGITFSTAINLLKNSQKNKMKTMLYMVKSRAEILLNDYLFEHDSEDADEKTSNLLAVSNSDIEEFLGGTYLGDSSKMRQVTAVGFSNDSSVPNKNTIIYCSWDERALESQGIDTKNLAKGDTIIIQYNISDETVDVASTKGYSENDDIAIHKLSEF